MRISQTALLVAATLVGTDALAQATTVFKTASPSIFTIQAGRSVGTAFVTGGGRYLVTAFHVTNGSNDVVVNGGRIPVVGIHRYDRERDICVYRLKSNHRSLQLLTKTPATGSKIFVVGTPLGFLNNTISEGIVSGVRQSGTSKMLQVTAPVSPGSSGSPVLDSKGNAIGMIVGSIEEGQALNFAVSGFEINQLLSGGPVNSNRAWEEAKSKIEGSKAKVPTIEERISIARDEIWGDDVIALILYEDDDVLAKVWSDYRHRFPELATYAEKRVDALLLRLSDAEARRKLGKLGVIAAPRLRTMIEKGANATLVIALGETLIGQRPSPWQKPSYLLLRDLAASGSQDIKVVSLRMLGIASYQYSMDATTIGFSEEEWRAWKPPASARDALLKVLNDSNADARRSAVYWMPPTSDSISPLSARLANDPDEYVRSAAAFMLGIVGANSALVHLEKALLDKSDGVRKSAVGALRKLSTSAVVPLIEQMLFDSNWEVRYEAAYGLRNKKQRSSLGPLQLALQRETVEFLKTFLGDVIKEIEDGSASQFIEIEASGLSWLSGIAATARQQVEETRGVGK